MQFVENGPEIPDELLHAHENGNVVFFCGAGISAGAGLPDFKQFVSKMYKTLDTTKEDLEKLAFNRRQYDLVLDLLENRLVGGKSKFRMAVKTLLQTNCQTSNIHLAIINLSTNSKNGRIKLVTTNFDSLFDFDSTKNINFIAPFLPVPKQSSWNGIVYLHGKIPSNDSDEINHLVLTSGDFGKAYLVERWAARFVCELLRNFTVCFVGYSAEDPVMRYILDANRAEVNQGEKGNSLYAFVGSKAENRRKLEKTWQAKNIIPIMYDCQNKHESLSLTLEKWAESYSLGSQGKCQIVTEYGSLAPQQSTKQDDYVNRVLWAISDLSGEPAFTFAKLEPPPPFEWIEKFDENIFTSKDLSRFGIINNSSIDQVLPNSSEYKFSFLSRPSIIPNNMSGMEFVSDNHFMNGFDRINSALTLWITRQLNNHKFIIWLANKGGQLHPSLSYKIKQILEKNDDNSPYSIEQPTKHLRNLWLLLCNGCVINSINRDSNSNFYEWIENFNRNGFTYSNRLLLRKFIAIKVSINNCFDFLELIDSQSNKEKEYRVSQEYILMGRFVLRAWEDINNDKCLIYCEELIDEVEDQLIEGLKMMEFLSQSTQFDLSHYKLPSLFKETSKIYDDSWTDMILILKSLWFVLNNKNALLAKRKIENWINSRYPCLRRLGFYCLEFNSQIKTKEWIQWLIHDNGWFLWARENEGDRRSFFKKNAVKLYQRNHSLLICTILSGPPAKFYRGTKSQKKWNEYKNSSTFELLFFIKKYNGKLNKAASDKLRLLKPNHLELVDELRKPEMISGQIYDYDDPVIQTRREIDIAPNNKKELYQWLLKPAKRKSFFYSDNWNELCRKKFYLTFLTLKELNSNSILPIDRLQQALSAWSNEINALRSWNFSACWIESLPNTTKELVNNELTYWFLIASKASDRHLNIMIQLVEFCLNTSLKSMSNDNIDSRLVFENSNNNNIGRVTQILTNILFKNNPSDNEGLNKNIRNLLTRLCDKSNKKLIYARTILFVNIVPLYRIDRHWTERHLLPSLDWSNQEEALPCWQAFLFSRRLYDPLIQTIKKEFLQTADFRNELGKFQSAYVKCIVLYALNQNFIFTKKQIKTIIDQFQQNELDHAAQTMLQNYRGAGDQKSFYWKKRIVPFWKEYWPKNKAFLSPDISTKLSYLTIEADDNFPEALKLFQHWFKPNRSSHILHYVLEKGVCAKFPEEMLQFIDLTIDLNGWLTDDFWECLKLIKEANPKLINDPVYQKLSKAKQN